MEFPRGFSGAAPAAFNAGKLLDYEGDQAAKLASAVVNLTSCGTKQQVKDRAASTADCHTAKRNQASHKG